MVEIRWNDRVYEARREETVLDTLIRGGAEVPFSCRKGSCHCCVIRAVSGHVEPETQRGLRAELVETGHFKPCMCTPTEDLALAPADRSVAFVRAVLAERTAVGDHLFALDFETEVAMDWRPGQFVNLRRADGLIRSYSISSLQQDDYFLRLHVRRQPDGAMSSWLCDDMPVGGEVEVQGPLGQCAYDEALVDQRLLVLGSGAGAGAMIGLVRDALARGHRGGIDLYVGVRDDAELAGLPHLDTLLERAAEHDGLRIFRCVSRPTERREARDPDVLAGHVTSYAFDPDMAGAAMFVCGPENMVFEARRLAVRAGIHRRSVFADPFTPAHPGVPDDRERIALVAADPELWAALGRGHKLRSILEDFYTRVYDDPRLAPFFHNATKERAVSKQYSFLRDLFTGERAYFGLRPFNAHHWMIISDDLFDYREDMFEDVLREHEVPTQLARRWLALHETFRRDIVKSAARGMFIDGVEHKLEGFAIETLEIDMVCDGCTEEMRAGERGRLHRRTGQLYCDRCAGRVEAGAPGSGSGSGSGSGPDSGHHAVVG